MVKSAMMVSMVMTMMVAMNEVIPLVMDHISLMSQVSSSSIVAMLSFLNI